MTVPIEVGDDQPITAAELWSGRGFIIDEMLAPGYVVSTWSTG